MRTLLVPLCLKQGSISYYANRRFLVSAFKRRTSFRRITPKVESCWFFLLPGAEPYGGLTDHRVVKKLGERVEQKYIRLLEHAGMRAGR